MTENRQSRNFDDKNDNFGNEPVTKDWDTVNPFTETLDLPLEDKLKVVMCDAHVSLSLLNCAWNYCCKTFSHVDVRPLIIVCYRKSLVDVGDVELESVRSSSGILSRFYFTLRACAANIERIVVFVGNELA